MKKYGKKVMVGLVALTAGILTANAKDVTVKEFLEEVEAKNPTAQDVYIIGDYAFTSKHSVTSQDIMLSAKSINISSIANNTSLANRTNKGDVYKEMLMQHLNRTMDANGKYSAWSIVNPKIGTADKKIDNNKTLSIHFIDYELVNDVTADVEDQLKKDAEELNKPDELKKYGFNSITYENNTLTFDIADINKGLVDYKDSGIVKMFKDIVSGNYGFTSITYTGVSEEGQPTTKTAEDLKSATDDDIIKLAADVLLGLVTKEGGQANTLTYLDVANKSTTAKVVYTDEYGTHEVTYTLKFTYDIEEEKDKDLTNAASTLNNNAITYGFKSIRYANKTATFEISDTQKPLAEFAKSGILDMFKQYIAGATKIEYTIGDKKVTIEEINAEDGVKYAAQLLCLMANNGTEDTCKTDEGILTAAQLKLGDVAGKNATANFTYTIGSETQTIPYILDFKYDLEEEKNETLTHYADGLNQKISTEGDQSGFSSIKYNADSRIATFTIKDGNKLLKDFSGKEDIINMFQVFVQDAEEITWNAGSKKEQKVEKNNMNETTVLTLAKDLLCAMAEKDSNCDPTSLKLSDVQGKTATATISYKVGSVTGTQTYTLEFVADSSVSAITGLNHELFNINKKLN